MALKRRLAALEKEEPPQIDPKLIKRRVEEFIKNFEAMIDRGLIEERKLLMKKIISRIDVDRDKNVVRFFVRKLPAVDPEIDGYLQKERVATDIVTTRSSGGPNN